MKYLLIFILLAILLLMASTADAAIMPNCGYPPFQRVEGTDLWSFCVDTMEECPVPRKDQVPPNGLQVVCTQYFITSENTTGVKIFSQVYFPNWVYLPIVQAQIKRSPFEIYERGPH